jgi:voltage-gated potassium channel
MDNVAPQRPAAQAFQLVVAATAVAVAVLVPLQVAFPGSGVWRGFRMDMAVTVIFAIDVAVNLFHARRAPGPHQEPRSPLAIAWWTLVDVAAALPLDLLFASPLALLPRMAKVLRLGQWMRSWHIRFVKRVELVKLAMFAFWLLLIAHWLACAWSSITPTYEGDGPTRYLASYYWVVETLATVGYGETTPVTNVQRIFAIGVMLTGVAVYGYVIGNVAGMLARRDPAKTQYFESIDRLNTFNKHRDLPPELRTRIVDYYGYVWRRRLGFDESSFLGTLPPGLRREVEMHLKRDLLSRIPLFRGLSEDFLEEVALALKPDVYVPGEDVFRQGHPGERMYFVISGRLRVIRDEHSELGTLRDGDFFGEVALFTNQPRNATVRAEGYCDLYALDRQAFTRLLERYPEVGDQLRQVAQTRHGGPR